MNLAVAALALLAFLLPTQTVFADAPSAPIVLEGTITSQQANAYLSLPFTVPQGIDRLSVTLSYTGREQHTALDLGIEDPDRFRGWSGGNKSAFTIGISDATPSYLPGPIIPGTWRLILAVPNIRAGVTSRYTATVTLHQAVQPATDSFADAPLRSGARWYRGDLHMHTAHSDGRCTSQSGKKIPCPLFLTLQAAVRQGLDFVAVTDHNTTSHYNDERELQPYFDQLLLIPGREMTTYFGHTNFYGSTQQVEFRVAAPGTPSINTMLARGRELGEIVSINHPGDPTGEQCMGCGWSAADTDMKLVNSIEVVNGGGANQQRHIAFWEAQLAKGLRITAIGGSDNHNPQENTIGHPTTVVYADSLSVRDVLAAIRAGHVCIDLTASRDRVLDMTAEATGQPARMGDALPAPPGTKVHIHAHVTASKDSSLVFLLDGHPLSTTAIDTADQTRETTWTSDGHRHWIRAEVRSTNGRLQVFGNPIYLNQENASQ